MHGGGILDFFSDAWNGAKKIYNHLKENRYAHKIRNIPLLGSLVDKVPYVGDAVKYADEAGFGKKKRKSKK